MVCAGCKNLDTKKKSEGKNGGCVYLCKKTKKSVRASNEICKNFKKDIMRSNDEYNKLYHEGLNYDNSGGSFELYMILGLILLVITIIMYLVNK